MDTSIKSMEVRSVVVSRFARVTVESTMVNDQPRAREMLFSVKLPEAAFISEFKMVVAGKTIVGEVKEKEIAKQQYQKAVAAGRYGGLVAAKVRETQNFDISTNVPANSSVEFHLVYLELLQRRLGKYDHVILVNPGQVIENFSLAVCVLEQSGITFMQAILPFDKEGERTENVNENLVTEISRNTQFGTVQYNYSAADQHKILSLPENERKVTIRYDVAREILGGEIQVRNGYFVHFFAPTRLPVLPKKVVFVIDCSGSMSGRKMHQTKEAFSEVLKELNETDCFNVVTFANNADVWKLSWTNNNLHNATKANIREALAYIKEMKAGGGMNLFEGLKVGADLLKSATRDEAVASMMIVLTDGQANQGISNGLQIRSKIQEIAQGRFSVFCLGFGSDVDERFFKQLADENDGICRKIYKDSDANLQLRGFFEEVASPLLLHVKISYLGSSVINTSQMECEQYFEGSEMVVVGQVKENAEVLQSSVTAFTTNGEAEYRATGSESSLSQDEFEFAEEFENFIEKIWAYYTIKELLHKKDISNEDTSVDKRILQLALKYKFVTSVTSMVVTLPEDEIPTVIQEQRTMPALSVEGCNFSDPHLRRRCYMAQFERSAKPLFSLNKARTDCSHARSSASPSAIPKSAPNFRRLLKRKEKSVASSSGKTFCGNFMDISSKLELPTESRLGEMYYWIVSLECGGWTKFEVQIPDNVTIKISIKKGTEGDDKIFEFEGRGLERNVLVEYHVTLVELTILAGSADGLLIRYAQVEPSHGADGMHEKEEGAA